MGVLRDGAVHHESASAAASHTNGRTGDHGHEDGLPAAQHRHGPQHQHGTVADHCTHAHGFATLSTFDLSFVSRLVPLRHVDRSTRYTSSPADQFHPPRA